MGDLANTVVFEEHEQDESTAHRDSNMRAAVIDVLAYVAVSVPVIVGLLLAGAFGWLWTRLPSSRAPL